MATGNNRDVRLGVEIQAVGEENLKRLASEVRALAKAGGDAAPEYTALANELDRVAAQARELEAFQAAAASVQATAAASDKAAAAARELRSEFELQATAARNARSGYAQVQESLDSTRRAIAAAKRDQDLLKQSLADGKVSQEQYAATAGELVTRLANLKQQQTDLAIEVRKARTAAAEAEQTLSKMGSASLKADEQARGLAGTLAEQTAAMAAAQAAGAKLGADFSDLAAAQERVEQSLRSGVAAIEAHAAAVREQAEADRLAALEAAGRADAARRAAIAVESELAALRESEDFTRRYAASQARAKDEALQFVLALDQQAAAADKASRRMAELMAVAEKTAAAEKRAAEIAQAFDMAEQRQREAAATERAAAEALGYVEAQEQAAAAAEKAARRAAELNAQAEKTAAAEKYVRELAAAFDAAEKQAAEAAVQVQRLEGYFQRLGQQRDVVKNAFGAAGLRSIQDIEQEMFKLQRAMVTLQGEFSEGRISVADYDRAVAGARVRLEQLNAEIRTIPGDRSVFDQMATSANNLITKFGALGAALATVGFAIKPVLDSFIALESATRILTQITGSSAEAARQIEFLRNTAQRSGQSFDDVSQSYAKFAASALQAGVSSQQAREAFAAVSMAAGNLGLSSDQAKRAMEALSQMASKGTVSMEELRQQLGDALPGVLPALAKQLGLTNKELSDLVESGGLLARDAIPAITAALGRLAPASGQVDGLVASWSRFKNIVLEAGTAIVDGPIGKALGGVLSALAGATRDVTVVAYGFSEALSVVGRTAGLVVAALTGNIKSFQQFKDELDTILVDSGAKLKAFEGRAYSTGEGVKAAGSAAQQAGQQMSQAGTAAGGAATGVQKLGDATQQAGTAAGNAATQHQAAAGAIAAVGQAAAGASTLVPKLTVDYNANVIAAELAAKTSTKLSEAAKSQADAIKALADITGNEVQSKRAAAEASAQVYAALQNEARAQQTVVDVLAAKRTALDAQMAAEGVAAAERAKSLLALDQLIEKETADATKKRESADAAKMQAAAAELAAEKLQNTADKLERLKVAQAGAAAAVERARLAMADGTGTTEQYTAAQLELAKAQGRVAQALDDVTKRAQFAEQARSALTKLEVESLRVKIEESRAREAHAKTMGDETAQVREQIVQKQLEVDIAQREVDQLRANAEARIEAIRQQRIEAEERGVLTPELQRQLDLQQLEAEALLKNARARGASIQAMKEEVQQRRNIASGLAPSSGSRSGATGGQGGTQGGAAVGIKPRGATDPTGKDVSGSVMDVMDRYGLSWNDALTLQSAGETAARKAQNSQAIDNSYQFQLRDRLRNGDTFSAEELPAIANAWRVARENALLAGRSAVPDSKGTVDAVGWADTLRQVYEKAQSDIAAAADAGRGALKSATPAAPTPAASTRTVNINLGGMGSTSINVASEDDAARLEAFFRQLEQAARRAGP